VLAVMREFDASKESIINLVVSPEQFVQAIVLERQYGEPSNATCRACATP
jgi:hypothetical protein